MTVPPIDVDPARIVYTPAHPVTETTFALEPRRMDDGELGVIAFSSVEQLVEQLGSYQPWIGLEPEQLHRLAVASGVERVWLDAKVFPFALRWAPAHVEQIWK